MNGLIQSKKQLEKLRILREKQRAQDEVFMQAALRQAEQAFAEGEIPVGAVIVKNGEIIAEGKNRKESLDCAVYHAEINAIINASKKLGWRLDGCEMYVTLEPCVMCAGAIVSSRIKRVVYGANEAKSGCFSLEKSGVNVLENVLEKSGLNFKTQSEGGVLEDECAELLKKFFAARR